MRSTVTNPDPNARYIGANLLTLADKNAYLLPKRMAVDVVGNHIRVLIDDKEVTRFKQGDRFDLEGVSLGSSRSFNTPVGIDTTVSVDEIDDGYYKVSIERDWELLREVILKPLNTGYESYEEISYQPLDDGELDAVHNHLLQESGPGFEQVAGVSLIDRMTHYSGSTDPRLFKLLADLDAHIEKDVYGYKNALKKSREAEEQKRREASDAARRREAEKTAEIDKVVDDFFQP